MKKNMMHVCGTCNKSLKFKSGLYRHNKTQHKGATVSCECGFTFTRNDNMKRHKSSGKCKVPSLNDSSNENIIDSQSHEDSSELDTKEQRKFGELNANLTNNTPSNEDQDTGDDDDDDDDSGFGSSSSDFMLLDHRQRATIKFKRRRRRGRRSHKKRKFQNIIIPQYHTPILKDYPQIDKHISTPPRTYKMFQPYCSGGKIIYALGGTFKHKRGA